LIVGLEFDQGLNTLLLPAESSLIIKEFYDIIVVSSYLLKNL